MRFLTLHVQLRYTPIWRRIRLPQRSTLEDLHEAVQAAFGWTNSHLFMFRRGEETVAANPYYESFDGEDIPAAEQVKIGTLLRKSGDQCEYLYDFGDNWSHDITVERASNEPHEGPWLLDGEFAGPPEDCGGVPGYERCAEFVRTGTDPWREDPDDLRAWLGNWHPDSFKSPQNAEGSSAQPEIDLSKIEEAALAIMSLTLHDGNRVWKGLDFDLLNALHERGWISQPRSRAKSVVLSAEGRQKAEEFLAKHFAK